MIVSIVLLCILTGVIVVAVHFYIKEYPPQFYKTLSSQIKSKFTEWTSDGETQNKKDMCLEWDDTKGMYYKECNDTLENQKFNMFYTDKEKTKPHGFGIFRNGKYYCFGPNSNGPSIEKKECDVQDLYQKFRYNSESQRLEYLGPNIKLGSSQALIPQSYQTNNKVIVWDTFNNDPKGNQTFF